MAGLTAGLNGQRPRKPGVREGREGEGTDNRDRYAILPSLPCFECCGKSYI